uniref:CCHC-type domain-containing protein n=1 Tax=Cannabis sativa TaxID=3483 RepID=A0A803Q6M0_CANSA
MRTYPDHCYYCGRLGHSYPSCTEYMRASDESTQPPPLPYENALRGTTRQNHGPFGLLPNPFLLNSTSIVSLPNAPTLNPSTTNLIPVNHPRGQVLQQDFSFHNNPTNYSDAAGLFLGSNQNLGNTLLTDHGVGPSNLGPIHSFAPPGQHQSLTPSGPNVVALLSVASGGNLSYSVSPQQSSTPGSRGSSSPSSSQLQAPLMISTSTAQLDSLPVAHIADLPSTLAFAIGSNDVPPRRPRQKKNQTTNSSGFKRQLATVGNEKREMVKRHRPHSGQDVVEVVSSEEAGPVDSQACQEMYKPSLLFVIEAKLCKNSVDRFKFKLGFDFGFEVPRVGLSGGLLLFWNSDLDVIITNYSVNHIHCFISSAVFSSFNLTAFYGAPNPGNRSHTWELLSRIGLSCISVPWCVLGDFNDFLTWEDKSSSNPRNGPSPLFRTFMHKFHLQALHPIGPRLTWTNNSQGHRNTLERLDWAVGNSIWHSQHPNSTLNHLDFFGSDHRAIQLSFNQNHDSQFSRKKDKQFLFENVWLSEPHWNDVLLEAWSSNTPSDDPTTNLLLKQSTCSTFLSNWKHKAFFGFRKRIKQAQLALEQARNSEDNSSESYSRQKALQANLDSLLFKEETYWRQRSRIQWLNLGDKNTHFFHKFASNRKRSNRIESLTFEDGIVFQDSDSILSLIQSYYSNLFTSQHPQDLDIEVGISDPLPRINPSHCHLLEEAFSPSEVKKALFQMGPDKAPATFKFNLNGQAMGLVTPSRGIRQGDPLFPYLFLMCAEGLSSILKRAESQEEAFGIKIARTAPKISHLLFADDNILFWKSNIQACNAIKEALDQSKSSSFNSLKDRIWSYLSKWQGKLLSKGGKEVLLKAVVQAIPTYAMSVFKLPDSFCSFVEKEMANFWWGVADGKCKLHWKNWKSLCNSKSVGGLGFRSLKPFNQAMLAKQAWRIQTNHSPLLTQLFRAKYFPRTSFLDSSLGHSPSYDIINDILSLPPPDNSQPDSYFWQHTPSGHYSVKTGYHVAKQSINLTQPSSSDMGTLTRWWKSLWSLPIPSKIRHFIFRLAQNSIPTPENLYHGHCLSSPICPRCHLCYESVQHALFECKNIKKAWSGAFNLFLCMLWKCWNARNTAVFRNQVSNPIRIEQEAEDYLDFYQAAQDKRMQQPQSTSDLNNLTWEPPPVGTLKLNTDAAVSSHQNKTGGGVIVRDHTGKIIGATAFSRVGQMQPKVVEGWVLWEGLKWSRDNGINIDHIEVDCNNLLTDLQSTDDNLSSYGTIINAIRRMLSSLPTVTLHHTRR